MSELQYALARNFLSYFDVGMAVDAAQKKQVFGIRYNVYCDEFKYEPAECFPDKQETDEFDENSLHVLVTHKASGLPAGCVRLVSPKTSAGAEGALPFEVHCGESLDREYVQSLDLDRHSVCEISRLAVDATFRRRPGEQVTRFGEVEGLDCTQQERRTFSLIAVTCFLAATAVTEMAGRTNVFAMMEPFLPRLLQRSGILFNRAGEDIDYHGLRAPYFITTGAAVASMSADLSELYTEVRQRLTDDFRS